jgi:hypothetical protein
MWLNDLKSGKNAEVYVNLAVATIVLVLDFFGIIEQKWVTGAILLVLALLSFGNLNARHDFIQLNETLSKLKSSSSASRFLKKRSQVGTIPELIEKAKSINLSMLAGHFVVLDFDPWEKKIQEGAKIRLLFANPYDDEHICTLTSRGDPITEGRADDLQMDIVRAIRKLLVMKQKYPGCLEFRFQNFVPPFGIFAINPESPEGIIKVEIYPYRTSIYTRPHFFLKRSQDSEWYEMFRNQFEEQWQNAADIDAIGWQSLAQR